MACDPLFGCTGAQLPAGAVTVARAAIRIFGPKRRAGVGIWIVSQTRTGGTVGSAHRGARGNSIDSGGLYLAETSRPTAWAWTVGVLAGLAACFNPVIGAVYLAWVIGAGRSSGFLNRRVLPLWLLPLLILAPWSLRNAVVMGGLVPVRDNVGLELYVSFNDCARYGFRENMRISCIQNFHPNSSIEEALAVGSLGEYRYNRDRLRRAVTWASLHPARAAGLTAQRIWYFWFPSEYGLQGYGQQRIRMLALHALTITSFFGVYCSLRRRRPSDFYILSWVVIFPLIYYLVQFDYRYRYPILWATWLLAADGILLAIASIGATSFLFRRAGDVRHAAGSMLSS